ncbi:MAG: 50S ribosomal protein L13P [Candidatus Aramenus sulfurataquae]|jgi:large subunit ribosomal protein L13|uniref:Large ribosomal subunit protein uL13 n=2 Tax=Candidatus Aramenus sulfurataquae TaxID=1326980 RepID=W7KZB4_9CREN|nr:50S ribosomal protein L13P [Candidatus Aramenus sulfurataquae]EWG08137.1 MAG: 50S ribosomal protein L13P [Candidatus Aramenus sulfurataquae]MCL7343020.1 50S ribosomal protein L13 [Candidatus Aramenus sulfurataquae]
MSQADVVIIDATNQILGRMCSKVVNLLKEGKKVYIVNAEKAVISGPKARVVEGYKLLFTVGTLFNPYKQGIRRPRSPINIVKRTIRGMLPKTPKGLRMLKNVKVYIGVPKELEGKQTLRFEDADVKRLKGKYITVEELAKEMGWNAYVKPAK